MKAAVAQALVIGAAVCASPASAAGPDMRDAQPGYPTTDGHSRANRGAFAGLNPDAGGTIKT